MNQNENAFIINAEDQNKNPYSIKKKEELIKLNNKIKLRINELKTTLSLMLIATMIMFSSCEKNIDSPTPAPETINQKELVDVQISLTTKIKEMPMTKSFDPTLWQYQFSDDKYELKFTNQYNTYTKQVSVNEMRAGTVIMKMFAGNYNVSYNPIHSPLYDNKIDVAINQNSVNINGTPITLEGTLEDALIIIDIPKTLLFPYPSAISDSRDINLPKLNYDSNNDFYYGYTNTRPINPLTIYYLDNTFGSVDIPTFQKGKVYWMSKEQNGTTVLNFPNMEVERITL